MGRSMSEALARKAVHRQEERVEMAGSQGDAAKSSQFLRRLPVGAEVQPVGGVHFRVWASGKQRVSVQIIDSAGKTSDRVTLRAEGNGYFSALVSDARAGDRYWYLINDDNRKLPDPASRFQPEGPHGPSEIIDPATYQWRDSNWRGIKLAGQVIYEFHVGTFTKEGTWASAARELPELADAGITLVEIMPIADFPGRFNWGYDGVDLFAPAHIYGRPDELRRFVDAAHAVGLGVILDVVYNHLGPDGNYLKQFAEGYFTTEHETDWGEAINFYGPDSGPVREYYIHNAGYWIDEFHLDGLRLDATQNIYDESADHIIAALTRHARCKAGGRSIVIVAENEPQEAKLVRAPSRGGYGLDGVWNDDFHHSAIVALRGRNEAYYSDFLGRAEELLSACKHGYLYQGQWSQWQKKRRGTPAHDIPPWAFITFLENHDQVSNSLKGLRLTQLTSPGRLRAMTALLLLGPGTPMLFHGQEFGATTPYLFFADHKPELAKLVHQGRKDFLSQFPSIETEAAQAAIDDPANVNTFHRSRLDLSERQRNGPIYQLHKDLMRLRREEPALKPQDEPWFDGAVLDERAFLLRYFGDDQTTDRLLIVNLNIDELLCPIAEPLLAAPEGMQWVVRWSSEDIVYGGMGTPALNMHEQCKLLGEAALWLAPENCREEDSNE
jgi:maltooligosyltrehalose trehalohydrolase